MKRIFAYLLAVALLLSLAGCTEKEPPAPAVDSGESMLEDIFTSKQEKVDPEQSENLMENIRPAQVGVGEEEADSAALTDFGLRLFQQSMKEGKNTLISPLSVLYALSMTANGADGNTLSQMEAVLGQPVGILNSQLYHYRSQLEDGTLHLANAIWFKDDPLLTVEESFLQTNADYYGAGIYKAPFDDATCRDINRWVEDNTNGMVKDILDKIPEEAVMYLVNTLAFDARWQEVYNENQVWEAVFTTELGAMQDIELMYSEENRYLEDEKATGFIKYYEDGKYAFAALLPKEGVTVSEYVQSLTGEQLQQMLASPRTVMVNAAIPKFETEFDTEMSEILSAMGMPDAFDWTVADFSKLGSYEGLNICIDRVLHKTFISVAEQGTRAGAATVVEIAAEGAMVEGEVKTVTLDRPFLYMIVDTETDTPIFMGTMMNNGEEDFLFVEPNAYSHTHTPAEEPEICSVPVAGYCGNTQTTVHLDGETHVFMYDDSVTLTDILINLDYDPNAVCRCMAEFTVDTEFEDGFEVNLTESFVRCERGQASLTQEQTQTIYDIIDKL